jgi:DNA invertase Pin-like site-specific DNA recombinase
METERYVGLVRVSTTMQGESRLGLEAGIADLESYCKIRGATLLRVLEEVGSGARRNLIDRPTLCNALTLCKRLRATLLVPKVDRLVRSTDVHTDIKRSGVSFRACDMPEANEFTLDIMVAVAAQEQRATSARVKAALAVYKREGRVSKRVRDLYPEGVPEEIVAARAGKLGASLVGCHLTPESRARGSARANAKRQLDSVEAFADILPSIREWRAAGSTLRDIASRLNSEGYETRNGAAWTATQVYRLLQRV